MKLKRLELEKRARRVVESVTKMAVTKGGSFAMEEVDGFYALAMLQHSWKRWM